MYWGDYLRDTMHLRVEGHGAYLLLLAHYWTTGTALPDNDDYLMAVARVDAKLWKKLRPLLEAFFDIEDGEWVHHRVEAELEKASRVSNARQTAGKEGGKRSAKERAKRKQMVDQTDQQTGKQEGQQNPTQPQPQSQTEKIAAQHNSEAASDREPYDRIEAVLRRALGAEGNPNPSMSDISPIMALIDNGVSLDGVIVPKIRAMAASRGDSLRRKGKPWNYIASAIADDLSEDSRRVEGAGNGHAPPVEDEDRWQMRLNFARQQHKWARPDWGPAPGEPNCRVPLHLQQPGDGHDWQEYTDER